MSSDLIERLRAWPSNLTDAQQTMAEAAARIEALEAALREVKWYAAVLYALRGDGIVDRRYNLMAAVAAAMVAILAVIFLSERRG
jgi:hypothetical protein